MHSSKAGRNLPSILLHYQEDACPPLKNRPRLQGNVLLMYGQKAEETSFDISIDPVTPELFGLFSFIPKPLFVLTKKRTAGRRSFEYNFSVLKV